MMLKRGFILFCFFCLLVLTVSAAQAQAAEFFGIDGTTYTPGHTITVRWQVIGVDMAILQVYDPSRPDRPVRVYTNLPLQGVRTIVMPASLISGAHLVLWSANRQHSTYNYVRAQMLDLAVDTPHPLNICPNPPDNCSLRQGEMQATYQPFENGFMIWRAYIGDVWAFAKNGIVNDYPESVYGLMPDNPITAAPPSGRSAPVNGFGRVWGNVTDVRDALGWALGPEVGYTMTVYYASEPFVSDYFFITLPDNQVVQMGKGTSWTFGTP